MEPGNHNNWSLSSDARQKMVNKIMDTLQNHITLTAPEGMSDLKKIALRFEGKIYNAAADQLDYQRKISRKMLSLETRSQVPGGNVSGSVPKSLDLAQDLYLLSLQADLYLLSLQADLYLLSLQAENDSLKEERDSLKASLEKVQQELAQQKTLLDVMRSGPQGPFLSVTERLIKEFDDTKVELKNANATIATIAMQRSAFWKSGSMGPLSAGPPFKRFRSKALGEGSSHQG